MINMLSACQYFHYLHGNGFVKEDTPLCVIFMFEKIRSGLCLFVVQRKSFKAHHIIVLS